MKIIKHVVVTIFCTMNHIMTCIRSLSLPRDEHDESTIQIDRERRIDEENNNMRQRERSTQEILQN